MVELNQVLLSVDVLLAVLVGDVSILHKPSCIYTHRKNNFFHMTNRLGTEVK